MYDYTTIRFKGGRRHSDNFESADCIVGDIDNTHSDNPCDWLDPDDIANRLHGVPIFVQYSRNHMKTKNGRSPRPKFHFVVPIKPVNTPEEYKRQWRLLKSVVPEMDPATKDCARFMFGGGRTNNGEAYPGEMTLTEFCEINEIEPVPEESTSPVFGYASPTTHKSDGAEFEEGYIICDGERTLALLKLARKYFFKYRGSPNRDELVWNDLTFLAESHCCPPFPKEELQRVFNSARGYAEKERLKWLSILSSFIDED